MKVSVMMPKSKIELFFLLVLLAFLFRLASKKVFCFEIPGKEKLELKVKAWMKYINLDLTKATFTEGEKRKLERDFEENYSLELSNYDLILLGSSTWGDEEKELQADMEDFYEELENLDLTNIPAVAFGCGDSDYTHFCGAVDLLEERLEQVGATLLDEGLRVDDQGDEEIDARAWAREIATRFNKRI